MASLMKKLPLRVAARRAARLPPHAAVATSHRVSAANSSFAPRVLFSHARLLSTTSAPDSVENVWAAVRVLRAPEAETAQIVEAIDAVRVDAAEPLEKERQALAVVESDAVAALLDLLRDADSTAASALLVPSFLALIRLASQPLVAQELLRLGAPELMTHFLSLPDPRLQAAASLLLGIVALDPAAEQAVSEPEVLVKVLQLLASPHEAIQRAGATCLANVAGHRLARERLAAAFALGNLLSGRDISAQDTIRENGGLAELVMLLSPAFPEEVASSAAWAIHHAVFVNEQSQALVADAGGLGLLVQHLSAATVQLQTNALLALASAVEGNVQNRAWCCANGVVDILQQVHEDDGDSMDENAKRALTTLLQELA
ncbi:hypothetical protein PybrP1_003232 [[Pythium] brassicae (nom. inval.)]|nr:hypothetical protein PybrP1_003232 [[Pythium] brassicae (nom. inval.)]